MGRGETENWIKDLEAGCFAHSLSCHRFWANQVRLLLLHATAYVLLETIRHWLVRARVARMTLETLQLKLHKIGDWVREYETKVRLRLASSHPGIPWWHALVAHPHRS